MKDWTLRVVLLGAVVILIAGCDWPMYRYNAAHTGYNNTEKTINVGNVANLTTRFVTNACLFFDSSPAIVNGVVYAGAEDGLYAFDAKGVTNCSGTPKTCAPLWRSQDPYAATSPAVANGMVYVSSESATSRRSTQGRDELLGHAEDLQPAVDGPDRCSVVGFGADGRERRPLRRHLGVRRDGRDELFGHAEGLQPAMDHQHGRRGLVARGGQRDRLFRRRRRVGRVSTRTA